MKKAKKKAAPAGDAAAPLAELSRDQLSVFLYVALLPEETAAIVKKLKLTLPGFRPGSLNEVERCDVLADELRAGAKDARAEVTSTLQKAFGAPPLYDVALHPEAAGDLLAVGSDDAGQAMALWRLVADPEPAVRKVGTDALDKLAERYYGPRDKAQKAEPPPKREEDPQKKLEAELHRLEEKAKALESELALAEQRVEAERKKGEGAREKLAEQLKEARAREARAVEEAARAREAAGEARRAREKAEGELSALRGSDAEKQARAAQAEAKELSGRLSALEGRLAKSAEREESLSRELEDAKRQTAPPAAAPAEPSPGEATEPEEAPATWLMPVYTREFYDSLEGWDRRIQRAAFKQAHLLALDHRHPSLRAIPLGGLPGYYRVRVATDVRLIYRRGAEQNTVEICSLIDREDLDRYIKQARTRAG